MLNRLLMVVHWFLFLWFLFYPIVAVIDVTHYLLGTQTWLYTRLYETFLGYGFVLFFVYIIALWIIKHRWIWFPWQHVKPKESKNE